MMIVYCGRYYKHDWRISNGFPGNEIIDLIMDDKRGRDNVPISMMADCNRWKGPLLYIRSCSKIGNEGRKDPGGRMMWRTHTYTSCDGSALKSLSVDAQLSGSTGR